MQPRQTTQQLVPVGRQLTQQQLGGGGRQLTAQLEPEEPEPPGVDYSLLHYPELHRPPVSSVELCRRDRARAGDVFHESGGLNSLCGIAAALRDSMGTHTAEDELRKLLLDAALLQQYGAEGERPSAADGAAMYDPLTDTGYMHLSQWLALLQALKRRAWMRTAGQDEEVRRAFAAFGGEDDCSGEVPRHAIEGVRLMFGITSECEGAGPLDFAAFSALFEQARQGQGDKSVHGTTTLGPGSFSQEGSARQLAGPSDSLYPDDRVAPGRQRSASTGASEEGADAARLRQMHGGAWGGQRKSVHGAQAPAGGRSGRRPSPTAGAAATPAAAQAAGPPARAEPQPAGGALASPHAARQPALQPPEDPRAAPAAGPPAAAATPAAGAPGRAAAGAALCILRCAARSAAGTVAVPRGVLCPGARVRTVRGVAVLRQQVNADTPIWGRHKELHGGWLGRVLARGCPQDEYIAADEIMGLGPVARPSTGFTRTYRGDRGALTPNGFELSFCDRCVQHTLGVTFCGDCGARKLRLLALRPPSGGVSRARAASCEAAQQGGAGAAGGGVRAGRLRQRIRQKLLRRMRVRPPRPQVSPQPPAQPLALPPVPGA